MKGGGNNGKQQGHKGSAPQAAEDLQKTYGSMRKAWNQDNRHIDTQGSGISNTALQARPERTGEDCYELEASGTSWLWIGL